MASELFYSPMTRLVQYMALVAGGWVDGESGIRETPLGPQVALYGRLLEEYTDEEWGELLSRHWGKGREDGSEE